jgi:hypothetical protein
VHLNAALPYFVAPDDNTFVLKKIVGAPEFMGIEEVFYIHVKSYTSVPSYFC